MSWKKTLQKKLVRELVLKTQEKVQASEQSKHFLIFMKFKQFEIGKKWT